MKFSMLTPPTDAPSRIPLSRGLPSASALAVNTGGLPNVLPQATMDVEASAAPYKAMARFAAAGGEVSEQMSNLILAAEQKKREADNLAVSNSLYAKGAEQVDTDLETLKTTEDHNTLRPRFNEAWTKRTQDIVAEAPNAEVSRALQIKFGALRVVKAAEVSDTVRKKTLDYHEAALVSVSNDLGRLITDPNTTEADRDLHVKNLENYYLGYARILPVDTVTRVRERTFTTTYNTLAQQALSRDPEKFLPKSEENPNRGDGYREFSATGKYPADSKYLNTLIDTTGPNLIASRNAERRREDERREQYTDTHLTNAWGSEYERLIADLDSGDPAKVKAASAQVEEKSALAGKYWTHGMNAELRRFARDTRKGGGTTDDAVYNNLNTKMLLSPGSVSNDEIVKYGGNGLAWSGDRSVASLVAQQRGLLRTDDIFHRPDYQLGQNILHTLNAGATDMLALYANAFKPADIEKNKTLYGNALAEFDRMARSKEWENKSLRDLAMQIRDKYMPLIYPKSMQGQGGPGSGKRVEVPGNE